MMRRKFIFFLLVLVFALAGCGKESPRQLTILHINDLHGHVLPERVAGWGNRMGGYAVFARWVKEVYWDNQARSVPTLLLISRH